MDDLPDMRDGVLGGDAAGSRHQDPSAARVLFAHSGVIHRLTV